MSGAARTRPRVVIVGGGFAGLNAARALRRVPVDVTLVDRRNFHLFQPLLYQVATGGLSPANIAAPLRAILKRQRNVQVLLAEVTGFDLAGRRVALGEDWLPYDTLVVATGVRHDYFGHADWEEQAPGLKTLEDATEIRRRILLAFEAAERSAPPPHDLTFVVVGGGPTGVELAGTLGELTRQTLRRDFRRIDPTRARILLVEGVERLLPSSPPELSARAAEALAGLGVTVRLATRVTAVSETSVELEGPGGTETVPAACVFWAAGVRASPLGRLLGAATDRAGRVQVGADCTVPGHPEIFVLGDLASVATASGKPLPGIAPVAIQQGRYVGQVLARRLAGKPIAPFRYRDHGSMATIGRRAAVAEIGRLRFHGLLAWLLWLFVHLAFLIGFENRLLVLTQWAWNYFTRNRSARLITGEYEVAGRGRSGAGVSPPTSERPPS